MNILRPFNSCPSRRPHRTDLRNKVESGLPSEHESSANPNILGRRGRLGRLAGIGRLLLLGVAAACVPTAAQAQTNCFAMVNFAPLDSNFSGPGGVPGVVPVAQGGVITRLNLDQNADGSPDAVFDLPAVAQDAVNYFLSPGQRFVIATAAPMATNCAGIGGPNGPTGIVIMRVPASGSMLTVVHTDCLPGGLLNGNGRWYESGICNRVLSTGACANVAARRPNQVNCNSIFVARSNNGVNAFYRIYDLLDSTGNPGDGRATFSARRCVEDNRLAIDAGGSYMVVNHDLACVSPNTSDLELVSICPSSPTFGQSAGMLLDDGFVSGSLTFARVSACTGDNLTIQFLQNSQLQRTFLLPRCCGATPAPTMGSCCTPMGTCSVTLAVDCPPSVGTFSLGSLCTPNPCVQPQPIVSIVNVASVSSVIASETFTYTLTVTNSGLAAATFIEVFDSLPSGTRFVSATDSPSVFGQSVSWSISSLGAGAAVSRSVTVLATCNVAGSTVTNQNYSVTGNGIGTITGPPVMTSVVARSLPTATLAVSAVASHPGTLLPGDTVTYSIDVLCTGTVALDDAILSIAPGTGGEAFFESVLSAGVGVAQIGSGGNSLTWTLSLNPGSSTRLETLVRIDDCFPNTVVSTRLNSGQIVLTDPCFQIIASAPAPAPIPVQTPVSLTAALGGAVAGLISPVVTGGVFTVASYQAVRAGQPIQYHVNLTNNLPTDLIEAEFSVDIPGEISIGSPALAAPVASGVMFDAASRRVSFSGPLAAGASVDILVNLATPGAPFNGGNCRAEFFAVAGTPGCLTQFQELFVLFVPPEPAVPGGLLAVDESHGLWRHVAPSAPEAVLCFPTEIFLGLGRGPNGDVWLAGLPSIMVNPGSLDLHVVKAPFVGPFVSYPTDVAVTPDGTVYFIGTFSVIEGMIARYDRATDTFTTVLRDPLLRSAFRLVALPDGRLVFSAIGGLYALDPSGPLPKTFAQAVQLPGGPVAQPQCTLLPPPTGSSTTNFAVSPTGTLTTLLVTDFPSFQGPDPVRGVRVFSLIDIDPVTLQRTVLDPAFTVNFDIFGSGTLDPCLSDFHFVFANRGIGSIMVFDDGDIAVGARSSVPEYIRVELTPVFTPTTVSTGFTMYPSDLEPLRSGTTVNPCDFDGNGAIDPDDLADFIGGFFTIPSDPRTDFNHDGVVDPDDLADYIGAFFAGC